MFDRLFVENDADSRKPWTVAVSFLGQSLALLIAVLIPLLSTPELPTHRWFGVLLAPAPPPRAQASPPAVAPRAAAPARFESDELRTPSAIPEKVALVVDQIEGPAIDTADSPIRGVIGSFPGAASPDQIGAVIRGILKSRPPPAPPEPVRKKPAAPRQLRIGSAPQAAKLVNKVVPVYNRLAVQARVQGVVKLEAIIATDGRIRDLRLISGHPLLVQNAMDAVKQWRYRPTLLNGEPVEVVTQIFVNFILK